jgi:hypothetical protein
LQETEGVDQQGKNHNLGSEINRIPTFAGQADLLRT